MLYFHHTWPMDAKYGAKNPTRRTSNKYQTFKTKPYESSTSSRIVQLEILSTRKAPYSNLKTSSKFKTVFWSTTTSTTTYHDTLPACFQDYYFKKNTRQIQTRNSNIGCLFVPSQNTTSYGLNSISHQAILTWNSSTKTHKMDLGGISRYKLKSLLINSMIDNY